MTERMMNFNAGPAAIPLAVLESVREEFLNYKDTGMSITELPHRSPAYKELNQEAQQRLRDLLELDDEWKILFVHGGARQQFGMLPMNFLQAGKTADYIITGKWAEDAWYEGRRVGAANIAADMKANGTYRRVPRQDELRLDMSAVYVHITSNNTIYGTQFNDFPRTGVTPLAADMTSDLLTRRLKLQPFGFIYAAVQKNLGTAGMTLVLIRESLLEKARTDIPTPFQYKKYAEFDSIYNTPPVFSVYMMNEMLKWMQKNGGIEEMEKQVKAKARSVYDAVDEDGGFYETTAEKDSRSLTTAIFRCPNKELEAKFIEEAKEEGITGVHGHWSVGGLRVCLYNGVRIEDVKTLVDFMNSFAQKNG